MLNRNQYRCPTEICENCTLHAESAGLGSPPRSYSRESAPQRAPQQSSRRSTRMERLNDAKYSRKAQISFHFCRGSQARASCPSPRGVPRAECEHPSRIKILEGYKTIKWARNSPKSVCRLSLPSEPTVFFPAICSAATPSWRQCRWS